MRESERGKKQERGKERGKMGGGGGVHRTRMVECVLERDTVTEGK